MRFIILALSILFLFISIQPGYSQYISTPHIAYKSGYNPNGAGPTTASGVDVDLDGDPDIIVSERDKNIVWIENLGNEVFSDPINITDSAKSPNNFKVADVDMDGDPDLVTASRFGHEVVVYFNGGDYEQWDSYHVADLNAVRSIHLDDLDGDGDVDLVAAYSIVGANGGLIHFENPGNGMFEEKQLLENDFRDPSSVNTMLVDDDPHYDIISAATNSDSLVWYQNDGAGNFGSPILIDDDVYGTRKLHHDDLNGDGKTDIILAKFHDASVYWFENLGGGNFSDRNLINDNYPGLYALNTVDFEGDGDIDVFFFDDGDNRGILHLNNGEGEFSETIDLNPSAHWIRYTEAVDLNQDSLMDLIYTSDYKKGFTWLKNINNDSFYEVHFSLGYVRFENPQALAAADINNDGLQDIAFASLGTAGLGYILNQYQGEFGDIIQLNFSDDPFYGVNDVHVTDLDGDQDQDIIAVSEAGDLIKWFENDGAGEFQTEHLVSNEIKDPITALPVDLDNDTDIDLVGGSRSEGRLIWFENQGSGIFTGEIQISNEFGSLDKIHLADIDDDDQIDLILGSRVDGTISWLKNLGDGVFSQPEIIASGVFNVNDIATGHFFEDENPDIAYSDGTLGIIWIIDNLGNGSFGSPEKIITLPTSSINAINVTDINFDEYSDIMLVGTWPIKFGWKYGTGLNSLSSLETHPLNYITDPTDVVTADVDGDGDLDAIVCGASTNNIVWYENTPYSVGIEEKTHALKFTLSPNPARIQSTLTVESSNADNYKLLIRDNSGKLIYKSEIHTSEKILPLDKFSAGNYIVQISDRFGNLLGVKKLTVIE